jgi:tetratricopeptide (TPR) repeat protein
MPTSNAILAKETEAPPKATTDLLHSTRSRDRLKGIRQLRHPWNPAAVARLHRLTRHPNVLYRAAARGELDMVDILFRKRIYRIKQKLKTDAENPALLFSLAVVFFRYAQIWPHDRENRSYFLGQSLNHLNKLIRLVQPKLLYFYYRGLVRKEIGEYRTAISDFRKVLHAQPQHWGALLGLLHCLFAIGDFQHLHRVALSWKAWAWHPYQKALINTWANEPGSWDQNKDFFF